MVSSLLKQCSYDLNINNKGRSFLHYAVGVHLSDSDMVRLANEENSGYRENLALLKYLLGMGADSNLRGNQGRTPIYYAIYHNRIGSVWMLLCHGARLDIVDRNEKTPIFYANYHGYAELNELLNRASKESCVI